ncbi:DUF4358 domain-containing protein [Anaerotruncus massiliensis (ex Liu et al. 2021)]|uniref:DUF4358 domain-containing protein n=1 Tax=Anaerotruncus massiliensis (ex Liu et al. 2021) TaxID=2321404 RepID=A0A498CKY1_9FIRM|nr:DUF4358 domain-containing protein [Anaerotruncus massiliensis (ex Liu et al. 2021)]
MAAVFARTRAPRAARLTNRRNPLYLKGAETAGREASALKRTIALLCALLLCLTGCRSEGPGQNAAVESAGPLVETAEPETAIEKIYENVTVRGLTDASDDDLTDKFFLDVSMLDSYWVRFSSGDFGLADVFILKPSEGMEPKVRDALEQVKLNRAKEFENYDVYDAHQIAQDAVIYEQGGYLIMLMLADTDAARDVIDQYIPKI